MSKKTSNQDEIYGNQNTVPVYIIPSHSSIQETEVRQKKQEEDGLVRWERSKEQEFSGVLEDRRKHIFFSLIIEYFNNMFQETLKYL